MTNEQTSRTLHRLVSPYGLAMVSYIFFLLACLIPPSTYSAYMQEPNFMFLDSATILFYTLCVASFIAGLWLVDWLFPAEFINDSLRTRISPTLFLLIPLTIGMAGTVASTILLLRQIPNLFVLLFSQEGGDLKEIMALQVQGRFSVAPLLLTGTVWWAMWRKPQLKLEPRQRKLLGIAVFCAAFVVIAFSIITVSRNLLMPAVAGIGILYVTRKAIIGTVTGKTLWRGAAAAGVSTCLLFFSLAFLRGSSGWDEMANALVGYTAASYNRLAAVVNGKMHFPYAGEGLYLSSVITHTSLLPISHILVPPDELLVWNSEFDAISEANLDGRLIWPGAFGEMFSDLGWYSILFVFGYGILYGFVWRAFKRGQIIGIVLYPWFGFCILFWLGTNYLLDSPIEPIVVAVVLLAIYEAALVSGRSIPVRVRILPAFGASPNGL